MYTGAFLLEHTISSSTIIIVSIVHLVGRCLVRAGGLNNEGKLIINDDNVMVVEICIAGIEEEHLVGIDS